LIDGDRAFEIETKLAELAGCQPPEMRNYLRGYVTASTARKTGWRFVRGSHRGTFVPNPEGADVLPHGHVRAFS
jgi:hypothetical protein